MISLFENLIWLNAFIIIITVVVSLISGLFLNESELGKPSILILVLVCSAVSIITSIKYFQSDDNANLEEIVSWQDNNDHDLDSSESDYGNIVADWQDDMKDGENHLLQTDADGNKYVISTAYDEITISDIIVANPYVVVPDTFFLADQSLLQVDRINSYISDDSVKSIVIPDSIDDVTVYISSCTMLEEIKFNEVQSDNVCSIHLVIEDCEKLKTVKFSSSPTIISKLKILNCPGLETVIIPGNPEVEERSVSYEPSSKNKVNVISDNETIKKAFQ